MIFTNAWLINFVVFWFRKIDYDGYYVKMEKVVTIPAVFLSGIIFSVESFGISDEKLQPGMNLRITGVVLFGLIGILIFSLKNSLKDESSPSVLSSRETPLPLLGDSQGPASAHINWKGQKLNSNQHLINADDSLSENLD